jgi:hypothetical protein
MPVDPRNIGPGQPSLALAGCAETVESVWAEIDACGVRMATDLLLGDPTILRTDGVPADIVRF